VYRNSGVVIALLILLGASAASARQSAARPDKLPSVAQKTAAFERRAGLLTTYLDPAKGRVWLELSPPDASGEVGRYLYFEGLRAGLGSNPVGLDRGQLGAGKVVALRRVGGRLLIEEENLRFRALGAPEAEQRAVRESFASSVLWGGEIQALDPDGRSLVDLTSFVVRDAHQAAAALKATGQGTYTIDESRSAIDLAQCLAFPDNLEFEAVLTFAGTEPGPLVRETAPTPQAVTLVQHHSLVRLPDDGYRPRSHDPRSGSFAIEFADYAAPLAAPIDTRWLVRHRLEKVDPSAARSRVKKPIVYYVDPGAPEPVRAALIEGAGWWARAFEAAGFIDAFRVELLPPGAHPLDIRYNVIEWVHRSTRGWSYGSGIIDPRTGEMLKGHVSLDSLRVRQDRLLFEGLAGADQSGRGGPGDPVEIALARIRQLAAHEVGHTLGLEHNFAASSYGRASVMDYPAPLVRVRDDSTLDFSDAYAAGIGDWDIQAIRYAYSEFPPGADEGAALAQILDESRRRGLLFISDADARPPGAAHPLANLWDNGADPVAALAETLRVREIALAGFGTHNVRPGTPLGVLQDVLAPVYFHHRYQLQAAIKVVGGLEYDYAVRGEGDAAAEAAPIAPARQRQALAAVTELLDPAKLDLPEPLLRLLLPRPPPFYDTRESFVGATSPAFDALGAAGTAAQMVVQGLLDPARAARLVDLHRRDAQFPGLEEVLDALVKRAFTPAAGEPPRLAEIRRTVAQVVTSGIIELTSNPAATPGARARAEARLATLLADLRRQPTPDDATAAFLAGDISRYLTRHATSPAPSPGARPAPPGDAIGCSFGGR
jgi:hypothetical protein